jgi:hypothetical protein
LFSYVRTARYKQTIFIFGTQKEKKEERRKGTSPSSDMDVQTEDKQPVTSHAMLLTLLINVVVLKVAHVLADVAEDVGEHAAIARVAGVAGSLLVRAAELLLVIAAAETAAGRVVTAEGV